MSDSVGSCEILDFGCHWQGLEEFFTSLIVWAYEGILSGLVGIISSIPVPSFLQNVSSYRLPDVVVWAAEPFQLGYGVGIITSAYTLRFIIRRLPVVG